MGCILGLFRSFCRCSSSLYIKGIRMLYWTPKLPLFRTVLRPNYDRIATYFEWVVKFTTEENLVIRFTVFL